MGIGHWERPNSLFRGEVEDGGVVDFVALGERTGVEVAVLVDGVAYAVVDVDAFETGFEHGVAQFGGAPDAPVIGEGVLDDEGCALGAGKLEMDGVVDEGGRYVDHALFPDVDEGTGAEFFGDADNNALFIGDECG